MHVNESDRRAFRTAYFQALTWTALAMTGDDMEPLDAYADTGTAWSMLTDDERARVESDCHAMIATIATGLTATDWRTYALATGTDWDGTGRLTWEQAGHDYALTRNGHGTGYWDRGAGAIGDRLTDWARARGKLDMLGEIDATGKLTGIYLA